MTYSLSRFCIKTKEIYEYHESFKKFATFGKKKSKTFGASDF